MAGAPGTPGKARVAVVTGSRSEFGLLEGSIAGLRASATLEPRVIVAGMHLDRDLGETRRDVARRFPIAAEVPMSPTEDTPAGMAGAVAEGIRGFSRVFGAERPATLLVLGDRIEPFAAGLAAAYAGIPIAHVHGGDVSGNEIDDLHRDAISLVARLHLAATAGSRSRLLAMAVRGDVEVVGAPGLDAILSRPERPREEVLGRLGIPAGPLLVVVHHPVPRRAGPGGAAARAEAVEVLEAALAWREETEGAIAVLYPNNDAGHAAIIEEIERRRGRPGVRIFTSLPREDFIDLARAADCLLGNSSSGAIESVSWGIPAVNVGDRQAGRERNGNVLDAPADRAAILAALRRAPGDPGVRAAAASRANLYGDGRASERIVRALERFVARERSRVAARGSGRPPEGPAR